MNHSPANSDHNRQAVDPNLFFQQETSPYHPDQIEAGRGTLPAAIRYLPHLIIAWSIGYVLYQAESNLINYIATAFLGLWSGYNLIAAKKKWPSLP